MSTSTDAVFARLESTLEQWAAEVASTHSQLSERVASARSRLSERPDQEYDVEQVTAALQAGKAQFSALQESLRQYAETARQAVTRTSELENAFANIEEDVRGLKNLSIHAMGQQASFEGLEPASQTEFVAELRALIDEQRDRIARLEQQLANASTGGPTQQQWTRLERDFARLRGEVHRLRGDARNDSVTQATAFGGTFEEIATPEIIDLDITGFDSAGRRRRMGEILLEAGVLTQAQLERALAIQQEQPQRRLGSILIELGYTESDAVAQVLASQARVPFVRLDRDEPDPSAVRLVNERLATHHSCIPVRLEDDRLILAMANPMDLIAIQDIEHATGKGVDPVSASADSIHQTIKAYYGTEARG